jgi:hypothetical protein
MGFIYGQSGRRAKCYFSNPICDVKIFICMYVKIAVAIFTCLEKIAIALIGIYVKRAIANGV